MPWRHVSRIYKDGTNLTHHVVISSATMMSSLRTNAVNDIETICKNSFSNNTNDIIMIAAPEKHEQKSRDNTTIRRTLVKTNHTPLEKRLVRQGATLFFVNE
jgi:hypothetical protein